MKSIRIFSSSNSPQMPSPSSQQEPTTFSEDDSASEDDSSSEDDGSFEDDSSSEDNNYKTSSKSRTEKLEYLEAPQDPSLLFRFLVYASGGTLSSTVKKVTRKTPKCQNNISDWGSSGRKTQYFWIAQPQCQKKCKRSKNPTKETKQAGIGDIAAHREDAHMEVMCDKSVNEKHSQKSVTFDIPPTPAPKPTSMARSKVSAPVPSSSRPASCTSAATRPVFSRCSSSS